MQRGCKSHRHFQISIYLNIIKMILFPLHLYRAEAARCLAAVRGGRKSHSVHLQTASTGGCEENSWKLKKKQGHHESSFLPRQLLEQQGSLL